MMIDKEMLQNQLKSEIFFDPAGSYNRGWNDAIRRIIDLSLSAEKEHE